MEVQTLEDLEKLITMLQKHGVTYFAMPGGLQLQLLPQPQVPMTEDGQSLDFNFMKDPFSNA